MDWLQWIVVALGALAAGAVNSVAGGGTVFNFSGLIWIGLPAVNANATNAASLLPGSLGAAWALWPELRQQRRTFIVLLIPTVLGSLLGAFTVVNSPESIFRRIVPFLILFATLIFVARNRLTDWARRKEPNGGRSSEPFSPSRYALAAGLQFAISTYGGYFGAGIGILMLTSLSLLGMNHLHKMNAIKNLLAVAINGTAMLYFIRAGTVIWPVALFAAAFALIGGYSLARYARRIDPDRLRGGVVVAGILVSIWMFFRLYLA